MDYVAGNPLAHDTPLQQLEGIDVGDDAEILSGITPADVSLEVVPQTRVHLGYAEPHHVIRSYQAEVKVYAPGHSKADDNEDLQIGTLRFHIINLNFPRERGELIHHPRDVCDSHSQDMYNLYAALFSESGELKKSVVNRLAPDSGGWYSAGALLYLESLSIDERFRGRKLGRAALEVAIRHYGLGCSFAALYVRAFESDRDSREGNELDKRLTRMYKKHGFIALPKSRYMIRNLESWAPSLEFNLESAHAAIVRDS